MADAGDIDDPEGSPALPAATLAAGATATAREAADWRRAADGEIWRLSWPVMLGLFLANLVSLVDIAMVGRLGPGAVAAVGYATQFHFLAQSVFLAVGFACVALMARAIGGGDAARARLALAASLCVAGLTALVIVAVVLLAPRLWLRALGAAPDVVELTVPYLNLLLGSAPLLALAMTVENALRADRDTRTPMRIAAVVAAVKITLNLLLIFGALGFPRLELVGAGLATLVSQVIGVGLFAAAVARAPRGSALALRPGDLRGAGPLAREVMRLALPGIGERLAMNLALLAYFRVLAEYGTPAIAAYTVGIRVLAFTWIPGTGFGAGAATLVGQALGAGDERAAVRAGWRSTRLALGVALTLGAMGALAREPLAGLFVDDAATVELLVPFLLCLSLTQPFLQSHFTLGGAHRGAGDTWTPFLAALAGNWLLRVPLAVLLAWGLRADVVWIWYALTLDHLTRAAWLALSFQRGGWRRARA